MKNTIESQRYLRNIFVFVVFPLMTACVPHNKQQTYDDVPVEVATSAQSERLFQAKIDPLSEDTLYYIMQREQPMSGDFLDLDVVTTSIMDKGNKSYHYGGTNQEDRKIIVAWIQTTDEIANTRLLAFVVGNDGTVKYLDSVELYGATSYKAQKMSGQQGDIVIIYKDEDTQNAETYIIKENHFLQVDTMIGTLNGKDTVTFVVPLNDDQY